MRIQIKLLLTLAFIGAFLTLNRVAKAQWGKAPTGWNDFYIGLTDDATRLATITTAKAVPTALHYRVRYINEGVDTTTNWYSHLPSGGLATNFITSSNAIGMHAAFNIYMLQEDAGADVAIANMASLDFMQKFFWNVRNVAQKANGNKVVFIVEPDTWGYLIMKNFGNGPTSAGGNATIRPNLVFCHVNDLGYPFLASYPNTLAGMAQGIIKTIRTFAPDAYVGLHSNHWATWSNGATGAACLGANAGGFYQCQAGMPFWSVADIDYGVNFQIAWYQELLGGTTACDKGDFLAVEKYGYDEGGRWIAFGATANVLYYGNTQYQNWLHWSKKLGQGINLPLLGWQIPIGNSTLSNAVGVNKYKDGFMEYYFANKQDFTCNGFIGLFMGPGVGASTVYTNGPGATGDDGWLFSNLRTQLDPSRPINMNAASIGACAATVSPTCPLPVTWLSFSGERKNNTDYLQWNTAQEKDNRYFEIEQSTDAIEFITLGKTFSENTSVSAYTWQTQGQGALYYRIKQTDLNGKYSYSNTILLNDLTGNMLTEVYPNPFAESFQLSISDLKDQEYALRLYDMQGREIMTEELKPDNNSYTEEFSLKEFPSGIYHLRITRFSDGSTVGHRLVKSK
jgi:hypothetical protein